MSYLKLTANEARGIEAVLGVILAVIAAAAGFVAWLCYHAAAKWQPIAMPVSVILLLVTVILGIGAIWLIILGLGDIWSG